MKQLILILLSITIFTACDNEPLEADVINNNQNNNGNGNNNNNNPLALNLYSLDVNSTIPLFGNLIVDSDFNFNANNVVNTATISSTFFGNTTVENLSYTRNNSGQIISNTSVSSSITTNETLIIYNGDDISEISYNFLLDDEEDYTYTFAYNDNTITRTELGSNISTIFTLNNNNLLIRKESFDGTNSILLEILAYDANGNCISSVISGEDNASANFAYDTNTNPLKAAFSDQYYLSFLNDDYSDDVGTSLAQFASTNNWIGISTPEGTVNFTLNYDDDNRIMSRSSSYDLGDGVLIEQVENFQFVN